MIVRMTLCSLDWVSVLCVATCVNKVTYAGCVYKLKCLPIVYVTILIILTLSGPHLVSSPDPTLEEGKGSGEFGHNPWARERNLSAPMRLQL